MFSSNLNIRQKAKARLFNWAFLFSACLILQSCAYFDRYERALTIADTLTPEIYKTSYFPIQAFYKKDQTASVLHVYIEGDGFAWRNRYQPSLDPTPKNPTGLKLANEDNFSNVLYLARPCQYALDKNCTISDWTDARFSDKALTSLYEALNYHIKGSKIKEIHLYGYSGGGQMALLLAAKRADISKVITIASPVNHKKWTRWHGISPLKASLNASDVLHKLNDVWQLHICGIKDSVVPCELLSASIKKTDNVHIMKKSKMKHSCCIEKEWKEVLKQVYRDQ